MCATPTPISIEEISPLKMWMWKDRNWGRSPSGITYIKLFEPEVEVQGCRSEGYRRGSDPKSSRIFFALSIKIVFFRMKKFNRGNDDFVCSSCWVGKIEKKIDIKGGWVQFPWNGEKDLTKIILCKSCF